MNYSFLEHLNQTEIKKFQLYIKEAIWRTKKFRWCEHMQDIWKQGLKKSEELLTQLERC